MKTNNKNLRITGPPVILYLDSIERIYTALNDYDPGFTGKSEITIKNDDYEFESVEDIRSIKEDYFRQLHLQVICLADGGYKKYIAVKMERDSCSIVSSHNDQKTRYITDAILKELNSHTHPLKFLQDFWPRSLLLAATAVCTAALLSLLKFSLLVLLVYELTAIGLIIAAQANLI